MVSDAQMLVRHIHLLSNKNIKSNETTIKRMAFAPNN